jgi:hypothetical protein
LGVDDTTCFDAQLLSRNSVPRAMMPKIGLKLLEKIFDLLEHVLNRV